jgi:hypothetical protein
MSILSNSNSNGWHRNTALCVNLKTILRSDRTMRQGKDYLGMLRLDVDCEEFRCDEHYSFVETLAWSEKRNPRVFNGKYISVTRRDDGSLRPNFKPMPQIGEDLSVDNYAFKVYSEIRQALKGLVEE